VSKDKKYTIDELHNESDEVLAGMFRDGIKQYFISMNKGYEGSNMGISGMTDAHVAIEIMPKEPRKKWVKRKP